MSKTLHCIVISIIIFAMFFLLDTVVAMLRPENWPPVARYLFQYPFWCVAVCVGVLISGQRLSNFVNDIGLRRDFLHGLALAGLFTLPMLIGFASLYMFNPAFSFSTLLLESAIPGLFEELYYRGLLFFVLWKYLNWRFLPAALLSSVLFGVSHWYQGGDWQSALMVIIFTGIGGLWFAWMLKAWQTLWLPIWLHTLMNAYWYLWDVSDSAVGDNLANGLRLVTIVFSLLVNWWYIRRKHLNVGKAPMAAEL